MATGQPYGTMAENAPEAIVPMNRMSQSGQSAAPRSQTSNYVFNNYAPISTEIDVSSVMREFGFQVGR